jgi:hypothetical protein
MQSAIFNLGHTIIITRMKVDESKEEMQLQGYDLTQSLPPSPRR